MFPLTAVTEGFSVEAAKAKHEASVSFAALPWPSGKQEHWKHTELAAFDFSGFTDFATPQVTGKNGKPIHSIQSAPEEHVLSALNEESFNDRIAFATRAFADGGSYIHVKEDEEQSCDLSLSASSSIARINLFYLERNSRLKLFSRESSDSGKHLLLQKSVFFLGEGSSLEYCSLQEHGANVFSFHSKEFLFSANATLKISHAEFGAKLSRVLVNQRFAGNGASCDANHAVFLSAQGQHKDITTNAFHSGVSTKSDIVVKGILHGKSSSVYRGLISIGKDAVNTDSFLEDRVLHVGKGMSSNSIPSLRIDNNEVKASHGASIANVAEEELFYLQSRGFPKKQAEKLVIQGFLEDVIDRAPLESFSHEARASLETRLA